MPAAIRARGETRLLIIKLLEKKGPVTRPQIAKAVEIQSGLRTLKSMVKDGQIQLGGVNSSGTQLYAAKSRSITKTPKRVLARDVREPDEVQLLSLTKGTQADDIVAIVGQKSGETTTKALINARLGQGRFRTDVMRYWGNACAVTGSKVTDAIRASHIKPWRDADVNTERLDPFNGLPLIASLDALFDKGLITFDEGGKLLISKQLKKSEHVIFGLAGKSLQKNLPEKTLKYLKYHRDYIFRG